MTPPDPQQVAEIAGRLSKGERERLTYGRLDWRDGSWQDHCGDVLCEDCDGYIPTPEPHRLSALDQAVRNFIQGNHHEQ